MGMADLAAGTDDHPLAWSDLPYSAKFWRSKTLANLLPIHFGE